MLLQQFTDTTKLCADCGEWKALADFSPAPRNRSGRASFCRPCQNVHARASIARRTEAQTAAQRERRRKRTVESYGLTIQQYESLLASQDGGCAVCHGDPQGRWRRPHIDHDHLTGEVRGILCHPCNTALGLAGEDPVRLRAMAAYLER